jgi:multiple sugar transport system substrate-binding protein
MAEASSDRSVRMPRRSAAAMVAMLLVITTVACGGSESGTPTLKWYVFQEPGGAFDEAAARCTDEAGGRYRVEIAVLPPAADQQREQLVRRLAAEDSDIDIIGMDVIWTAEFAEANWILPWRGEAAGDATDGAIGATVDSATYQDQLWAAPFTSNTQLLWYRKDLVEEPPRTWEEMIAISEDLAEQGEPSLIQVQGNRYEGYTVWFSSLLASAGGSVLDESGRLSLEREPTERALTVMRDLATSAAAADPSLSTSQEDQARLAFEAGQSAFMVNYTFVYPSAKENAPEVFENMAWARYPGLSEDEPSRVTIGGINLGVGAFSEHPDLAFEAATCIRQEQNQVSAAVKGGLLPTNEALYDDPEVQEAFPFADVLRATLTDATLRAPSPAYNDISLAIQRTLHPADGLDPAADADALRDRVDDALQSKGLL